MARTTPVRRTPSRPTPSRSSAVLTALTKRAPGKADRGRIAEGVGLVAGFAALAAGGLAVGLELERRIVSKRLDRDVRIDDEQFFALRSSGPTLVTPDGVLLHTEIDEPDQPTDDVTLVFVHGYALSMDCWHFQRKHFRGTVRQVLYDQRSHGRSTRSDPELCRIPQLADDLGQVLDEITGDRPVVLVGHSMGGMTIMHLAQSRPELFGTTVLGVALFSTAAGEMADHSPIPGLPGRSFTRVAEPLLATLNRLPQLVERSRRAGTDLGYVVTKRMSFGSDVPASYVEFVSEMLAQTPLDVVADFYPAFAELDEYVAFPTLGRVDTVVVGGRDDLMTPIERTDRMVELLPDTETITVPDCGHLGMIEHAGVFNSVLDGLLTRARATYEGQRSST
ncbi:MAG TPA: alpha/beta hydrolase [Propionibacteriaceae bacterium]